MTATPLVSNSIKNDTTFTQQGLYASGFGSDRSGSSCRSIGLLSVYTDTLACIHTHIHMHVCACTPWLPMCCSHVLTQTGSVASTQPSAFFLSVYCQASLSSEGVSEPIPDLRSHFSLYPVRNNASFIMYSSPFLAAHSQLDQDTWPSSPLVHRLSAPLPKHHVSTRYLCPHPSKTLDHTV